MTFTDDIAKKAVDRYFQPPNAARAARRQVFTLTGLGVLVVAALEVDGPLSWLLWAWAAYRVWIFAVLVVVGPKLADELTRRLSALPPYVAAVLAGSSDR